MCLQLATEYTTNQFVHQFLQLVPCSIKMQLYLLTTIKDQDADFLTFVVVVYLGASERYSTYPDPSSHLPSITITNYNQFTYFR